MSEHAISPPKPPYVAWFVVEVDIDHDIDDSLHVSISGPFGSREKAQRERDAQKEVWMEVSEEWGEDDLFDFKGWKIVKKYISDPQLGRLERKDEESYQNLTNAANAVSASLLAEEGIGPFAGDRDGR